MFRVGERKSTSIHGLMPAELGDFIEHDELVLEDVDLLLFSPALVGHAVVTVLGFGTELTHNDGLVV